MAVRIALGGDVMLGRGVTERLLAGADPASLWGDVLPLLHAADLRLVNLECAVAHFGRPWRRTRKAFHFRAHPRAIEVLDAAQIDACALANNHVLDFETEGLLETLHLLDQAGIAHAGAGRNLEEAWQPAIVEAGGARVAIVSITDHPEEFAATLDGPGTAFVPISPSCVETVERAVRLARAQADLVVVSAHWGPNFIEQPPSQHRAFARAVLDRGADLFHGHSAHVLQGVEVHQGKLILYDTGDLLDDYAVDPTFRNDWSMLFHVTLDGSGFSLELFPLQLAFCRVGVARGDDAEAILARMQERSEALGTRLERHDDRLVLRGPHDLHAAPGA